MSIEGGPAAILGALGVAALAGGLAFGAHMIAPAGDTRGESIAMSDDFCTLMDEMVAYSTVLEASDVGNGTLGDGTTGDDPATIEAIHAQGQVMLDAVGPLTGYVNHAAELVTDPDVAAAFRTLAKATEGGLEYLGRAALDAESSGDYLGAMFGMAGDPDLVTLLQEGDEANLIVEKYVVETCGRDILGDGGDIDTVGDADIEFDLNGDSGSDDSVAARAVKAYVSLLGDQMTVYYLDWEQGDPQARFEVSGNGYELDGTTIGWSNQSIELTDQYANGPYDWCVEVTSADDPERPWTFSAQSGLAQGSCS